MTTETTPTTTAPAGSQVVRPFRRRLTAALVAIATASGVLGLTTSPAGAAASWQLHQLDSDRCYDAATLDTNYNGYAEHTWFDLDNDCKWDTHQWNTVGGDHFAEALTYDMNEDGRWEVWLIDTNQIAGWDIAYFDDNGDGYYDRWSYLAAQSTSGGWSSGYNTSTSGGAFSNLMVTMARFSGVAAW